MNYYKALNRQEFSTEDFSIVPIRFEDRIDIMRWRNEQIYHLRQTKILTETDQNTYFNTVVAAIMKQEKPDQILFSYLKNGKCIGYGGLVHINWIDNNAEISFIIETRLESRHFTAYWNTYLSLIEEVAFKELKFHKIYTYAFDIRPHLYPILNDNNYKLDARLKDHCRINNKYCDVLLHYKINPNDNY
jgi:RimJ/RimL family protein N-acetyltransferase